MSYFSSLTGKPHLLVFQQNGKQFEIGGTTMVAVNESTAHLTGLLTGLGIGQTFGFMARPHIERGDLTALLQAWDRPWHPIHLLYPSNRHLQAKTKVFIDWVSEVFARFDCRAQDDAHRFSA